MAFWKNDDPSPATYRAVAAEDFRDPLGARVVSFEQGILALLVIKLGAATGRPVVIGRDEVERLIGQRTKIQANLDPESDGIRLMVWTGMDDTVPVTGTPQAVTKEVASPQPVMETEGARKLILE